MSVGEAMAALEAALLCSRSKAVRDLAEFVLGKLAGWVEVDSESGQSVSTLPEETGNAARCRRYRVEKERKRHADQHGRDMGTDMGGDMSPLALSSLSPSSDFKLSSEIPTGSSMSTGAGATPEATPNAHESRTQPVAKRARGSRVPASDASRDDILEFAISEGIDHRHPEWARFLDHWRAQPGQRGVKLDWGATWRNWIRRSAEYGPRMGAPTPVLPYHANPTPQRRTDGMRCELHGSDACDCERKGDTWRLRPAKRDGGPVRIGGAKP